MLFPSGSILLLHAVNIVLFYLPNFPWVLLLLSILQTITFREESCWALAGVKYIIKQQFLMQQEQ